PVVHPVTVDYVSDLEARQVDFANSLDLVVDVIAFEVPLGVNVGKDTIASALSDVEGLPVPGINEPIDIGLELSRHLRGKYIAVLLCHGFVTCRRLVRTLRSATKGCAALSSATPLGGRGWARADRSVTSV